MELEVNFPGQTIHFLQTSISEEDPEYVEKKLAKFYVQFQKGLDLILYPRQIYEKIVDDLKGFKKDFLSEITVREDKKEFRSLSFDVLFAQKELNSNDPFELELSNDKITVSNNYIKREFICQYHIANPLYDEIRDFLYKVINDYRIFRQTTRNTPNMKNYNCEYILSKTVDQAVKNLRSNKVKAVRGKEDKKVTVQI